MICRQATEKDAHAIVGIVKAVFGNEYSFKQMYDVEYVKEGIVSGRVTYLMAFLDTLAVSMMAVEGDSRFKETLTLRSLMTIKGKQFDGSAKLLHDYFFEHFDCKNNKSIYSNPVTGHTISQHFAAKYDFKISGVLFNGYLSEPSFFVTNPDKKYTPKQTTLLCVHNLNVTDVGTLYLPEKLFNVADAVYGALNTTYKLCSMCDSLQNTKSELNVVECLGRFNTEIVVSYTGVNCFEKVMQVISSIPDNALNTFQIYLNISCPQAISAINDMLSNNFYFAGFKPLGQEEYATFHFSKHIIPEYNEWALIAENSDLITKIANSWR